MKCIACGNEIKNGMTTCTVCGAKQPDNIVNQNIPNMNMPYQGPMYGTPNMYYQSVAPKKTSGLDVAGTITAAIGLFYTFCIIVVLMDLGPFIEETFSSADLIEYSTNGPFIAFSMTWLLFLASIIGIITSVMGRKKNKNGLNLFGVIANLCVLAVGIISTFYIIGFVG